MCDLFRAVAIVGERSKAAFTEEDAVDFTAESNTEQWTLMCAGTKADAECLLEQSAVVASVHENRVRAAMHHGLRPGPAIRNELGGAYMMGVLTGMVLEGLEELTPEQAVREVVRIMTGRKLPIITLEEWLLRQEARARGTLWTRQCAGVREAERDRRKAARSTR